MFLEVKSQMKKAFALFELLAKKDILTAHHSLNVACLTKILATKYIKTELDKDKAFIAGLLHDVGKIKLPDFVFSNHVIVKPEERAIIEMHPVYSREILECSGFDADIIIAVSQHHERFNGSGYPSGLKGYEITPAARLLSIVDSFSAILEDRPYRKGVNVNQALDIILKDKNLYDVDMLTVFIKNINRIMSLSGIEFEKYNNNFYLSKNGLYRTQKFSIGGMR